MRKSISFKVPLYGQLNIILFSVLLILKLTHAIAWSWWWVLAPLWIPVGVVLLLFTFIAAVALMHGFDSLGY